MTANARPEQRHDADAEGGFTLLEMVISVVLLMMITAGISAAFVSSMNATSSTKEHVRASDDAQLIQGFFTRDAQAAGGSNPSTGFADPTLGVTAGAFAPGCTTTPPGAPVVGFKWIDLVSRITYEANYSYVTTTGGGYQPQQLLRTVCSANSTGTSILANNVVVTNPPATPPVAWCDGHTLPPACPSSFPKTVSMSFTLLNTTANITTPFPVTLTASLRPQSQPGPDFTQPNKSVALIALGGGCNTGTSDVELSGNSGANVNLYGNVFLNTNGGSCSSVDAPHGGYNPDGPTSVQVPTGTTSCTVPGTNHPCTPYTVPVPDPYAGLTPLPGTPANCTGSDSLASHIGGDGNLQPGVYKSDPSLSTSISFDPGTYIFCNGLTVSGNRGANINNLCNPAPSTVRCPVLFYFQGGSLNVSGNASLALSAPTSGNYTGLLIWQPGTDATPISVTGNGAITLLGAIYAPKALVTLGGNGSTPVISSIVASSIALTGNSGADVGILPAPTVTSVSPASAPRGTQHLLVTITGTNFLPGQYLNAAFSCAGVTVDANTLAWTNSTTLTGNVSITNAATLGPCNVTVTNGDGTTATGTGVFTVTPVATKLAFTSSPVSGSASATPTIGPITVQEQDAANNPVNAPAGGTIVNLTSNSSGTARFSLSSGGTTVTQVTIPAGQSFVTFYYGDTKAGTPTVTAASTGLTSAAQTETISAAAPSALAFTNCSVNGGAAGSCGGTGVAVGSNGFMDGFVSVVDAFGNTPIVSAASTWTVTISSNNSSFVVTLSPVTITGPASQSGTRFHVKLNGTASVSATLTAHVTAGAPAVADGTMTVKK